MKIAAILPLFLALVTAQKHIFFSSKRTNTNSLKVDSNTCCIIQGNRLCGKWSKDCCRGRLGGCVSKFGGQFCPPDSKIDKPKNCQRRPNGNNSGIRQGTRIAKCKDICKQRGGKVCGKSCCGRNSKCSGFFSKKCKGPQIRLHNCKH